MLNKAIFNYLFHMKHLCSGKTITVTQPMVELVEINIKT